MFVPSVREARWGNHLPKPVETATAEPTPTAEPSETATALPDIEVPVAYAKLITDSAKKLCPAVPADILAAQLAVESSFKPRAKSPAGARGIAQFMPSTWKAYGYDANEDGEASVWDPADAIPSAAKYNCSLLQYTDGVDGHPIVNMLAAYNAGPGAVREYNGIPPFEETQAYVDKVISASERLVWPKSN